MDASTSSIHEPHEHHHEPHEHHHESHEHQLESHFHNMTCHFDVNPYHSFLVVAYSVLFLVGFSLNSFTLWFHCHGTRGRASKSWMIYLKHLTAADFLLCATLPLRIIYYTNSSFTIHLLYCSIGAPLLFVNWAASILFMAYIAANRYMKIFYSMGSHFLLTPKASHIISTTTWAVLLTMTAPYCILMLINEENHDDDHSFCDHLISEPVKPMHILSHAFAFLVFLSGLVSLVYFYYSTSRRLKEVQQAHLAHLTSSKSEKLVTSRRNMLVLVSVYCFCFVPYHIVQIPYIIFEKACLVELYYIKEFAVLLSIFNICLDPLIYVFLCKEFRAQLHLTNIFGSKPKKNTSSVDGSDSVNKLKTVNIISDPQGQRQQ
ncbi:P2Y purinoceptor 14-like [Gambusia affinis]|uniref:P2Y purinoceptor 14-like n=1 Tax=Gambusia affinis TaxID=33528 RepID=UPI001CDB78B2|nr:P2Y purinoceptor 14-like [Gambusia affinis]XP_043975879.1 P2Y purinoceptor 14-like [Gambusia affinis]XP_043975880.1 P2Y purinoceptor 14-like [Gambusia affinis]